MAQHALLNNEETAPVFTRPAVAPYDLRVVEAGRMVLARLQGPLDGEYQDRLLARLRPLCTASRKVVLDLRWASFVDSAGVRALLELNDALSGCRGELRLVVQPRSGVARTLSLLQLTTYFRTFGTASEAWMLPSRVD